MDGKVLLSNQFFFPLPLITLLLLFCAFWWDARIDAEKKTPRTRVVVVSEKEPPHQIAFRRLFLLLRYFKKAPPLLLLLFFCDANDGT